MKRLLIVLFLIISSLVSARTYYVSPNGTDGPYPTRGTFENPWKSWHYAFNNTTRGDTCYFRGGVYPAYSTSIGAKINTTAVDGYIDNPTCFFAYPDDFAAGNYPVLDCYIRNTTNWFNIGVELSRCSHIYFKGLTVKNCRQFMPTNGNSGVGWYVWSESYSDRYITRDIRFENCVAHHTSGPGFKVQLSDSVYFINCDAFNCCDSLTAYDEGGNGGGYVVGGNRDNFDNANYSYAYLYGCRAWNCSDQGFAFNSAGQIVCEYSWSINNGNVPFATNTVRKGSGWKLWYSEAAKKNTIGVVQIIMRNCIGAYNAMYGINWTDGGSGEHNTYAETRAHVYNNFYYHNAYYVYNFTPGGAGHQNIYDGHTLDTVGLYDHVYYNNLSYVSGDERDLLEGIGPASSNNLFNVTGTPVNDLYFLSLDTTGMLGVGTRQKDGSLPETNFGKPAPGSPLIDAGIDVFGIGYNGEAPDIGWFESSSGSATPATPVYVSSIIQNATPSRLEMTYNLTLANIVPAASSFTVMVNSSARSITSVAISGNKVLLTLSNPVVYGDVVTVAYTKPASNTLQTTAGGQAATLSARQVTNNCTASGNQSPVVNISSPTKGTSFFAPATINITTVVSDPDGTISKVEFYNGNIKLFELTSTPYSYTWKDVGPGTYSLTAVATDNLNATTTSSAVEVVVVLATPVYDPDSEILNLYPNPNDGHFKIDLISRLPGNRNRVIIFSLAGKTVYDGTLDEGVYTKEIDLSGSAPGTYIFMITNDQNIVTAKKFIKN
ncbi:MAG: Ig-like domain-containing protein [Bacteroidales bacterium]|nr:Ig-like domain-containing protein [Bacteroidales bacterium]